MDGQQGLFHGEHLPPRLRYQKLFSCLPEIPYSYERGRPRVDPNVLVRCFIYRSLRRLPTLSDLTYALRENPSLAEAVGLDPFRACPSVERFSRWLRTTPNEELQCIRVALIRHLVAQGVVRGKVVAFDSAPISSPVRENNLKTRARDRFNKERYPNGDPEARLGVYCSYAITGPQKLRYFWGYRNHIIVDFDTELPLWEFTHPADYHETRCAIPLLDACANDLQLSIEKVCADSEYDSEKILKHVIEVLHAQPIIARNPRTQTNTEFRVDGKHVTCSAGLDMIYKGRMTPKRTGITYFQYCCPLHYRRKMRQLYLLCPANHPKFFAQKGCNCLIRETPSVRTQIPYGSDAFTNDYNKRTSVERVFSRLLSVAMQDPTIRGLQTTRNFCTLSHITALLVAVAAHESGHDDKLAFVRSFVPNFMDDNSPWRRNRVL
jgi:hypothetical protein